MEIKDISEKDIGKEIIVTAKVKSIRQTSGPTVFELKDNSGSIKCTGFSKAGERAFPTLMIGELIKTKVVVKQRNNTIELEIMGYDKIAEAKTDLSKINFLIKSKNLEKLRPLFTKAAEIITSAIRESRPIFIRHHDDVDGYTSGLVLEKALKPLIDEASQDRSYIFLTRSSSRTPFYDYTDALRDLNSFMILKDRHGLKPPLIILTDLGSNNQSIASIKRLLPYGIEFIIIDHHKFDEENKGSSVVFLNPQVFDMGSDLNAGALCSELALFIDPDHKIKHLPALSGTADKSQGEDYEEYLKLSGLDNAHLEKWAFAIDHDLYYLRFQEESELLEDLFFPTSKNKEIIDKINKDMKEDFEDIKAAAKKYVRMTEFKKFKLILIDKVLVSNYGEYASSKLTRITHDLFSGPRITLIETEDSISYRADGVKEFSGVKILRELKLKFPYALLNGGGHDDAGNIKFNAASKTEILNQIMHILKEIDN